MLCSDAINEVTTNKELLVKSEVCHSVEHKGFYIYNYGSVAQLYNISATHYTYFKKPALMLTYICCLCPASYLYKCLEEVIHRYSIYI